MTTTTSTWPQIDGATPNQWGGEDVHGDTCIARWSVQDEETNILVLEADTEALCWHARFDAGTPAPVILAAWCAALVEVGVKL